MTTNTALTIIDTSAYAVADLGTPEMIQDYFDQLGVESLGWGDFTRISAPSGKASSFEVQDGDAVKTFEGIIVHVQYTRAFYVSDEAVSGALPDCASTDNRRGRGLYGADGERAAASNGGWCAACPMNEFGSGKGGAGKACKERALVYVLTPDAYLPAILSVPSASLRNFSRYVLRLRTKKPITPPFGVVTRFALKKEKSAGGTEYHQITFEEAGRLAQEPVAAMAEYQTQLLSRLATFSAHAEDLAA